MLARARALFTRATAQGLFLLSRGGGLARLGDRNVGDYVTERLWMSVQQAQQIRAVAEGLQSLPHVDAAWARGDLKYCVVRLLVGKVPAVEDELWSVAARHKTENQVRALMRRWEKAKANGEVGDEWRAYVEMVKAGGNTSGKPPGEEQRSQDGEASGSRSRDDSLGDTVDPNPREDDGLEPAVETDPVEAEDREDTVDPHRAEDPEADGEGGISRGSDGPGRDGSASVPDDDDDLRTAEGRPAQGGEGVDAGAGASVPDRSEESEEEDESRGQWMQFRVNPDVATRWPTPLVPPGLAFKQQLKQLVHAYASGKCTTEFWSKSLVRLRFWLPEAQKEAWEEARLAVSILSGSRRETATVDQVIEHLVDAFLREWAAKSLEEIKKHPIREAGGWKCSVPTCTNRAWLEDHHIRFLSRGGSNHPSNRAPLCWFHHHNGVHAGRIILEGTAPDGLMWRLGVDDQGDHMMVWGRQIVETLADAA